MIYAFIKRHSQIWKVGMMCKVLKVSRNSYYYWCNNKNGLRKEFKEKLKTILIKEFDMAKKRYGSPRLTIEINKKFRVSRPTVAKYMKELNLCCKYHKKYKITTDSSHKHPVFPNVLERNFTVDEPGKVYVSDITYVPIKEGFLYLTTVIDLFDRKPIGYSISQGMKAEETVIPALKMALTVRVKNPNLIFHSDRGTQYACTLTANYIKSFNVTQSMSRKGDCWDNAVAESFFKTLKVELLYGNKLSSYEETKLSIFEYIEVWYNRKRRHSALKNMTPDEFLNEYNNKTKSNESAA